MATVIPKLRIDPRDLHTARRKLQCKQADEALQLTGDEREALLRLIRSGKRTLYPGQRQLDHYQYLFDQLAETDNPISRAAFAHMIECFEAKYCE